ncbi:hypothetical protein ILYODFUR_038795 [Ilyodon furcidens]|uniref:Uncharacterized protein n=1 Tax=Ilyodon furcidens TaxID=33524 RepID=A0ABV0VKN4_9TELE
MFFASLSSELKVLMNDQLLKRAPLRLMSVCSLLNTQLKAKGEKLVVFHVMLLNYSNTVKLENTVYDQRFQYTTRERMRAYLQNRAVAKETGAFDLMDWEILYRWCTDIKNLRLH